MLGRMIGEIRRDVATARTRDPAARGVGALQVLATWPGVHALLAHRVANALYRARVPFLPLAIAAIARSITGIEIHPAATIGEGFFIDHGMGVVIGETTVVGRNVTLLQGVTLGGTSLKREKRHPTLGDNVVVGTGAAIIGAITIGEGSRIGAGSVVVRDVPPNSVVVGVPGRVTYRDGQRVTGEIDMNQTDLPDPVARAIEHLLDRIRTLEGEVESLRKGEAAEEMR
jgi:serine O-acetyltransferase